MPSYPPNLFSDIYAPGGPAGGFSAPSYSPPSLVGGGCGMPPPVTEPGKYRKTIVIVLVVVAVLLIAFMLWRARSRLSPLAAAAAAKLRGSSTSASGMDAIKAENFQRDIEQISDAETKADMKEWFTFWKVAKRPVIKDMLTQVLTVNTQPQAPRQPMAIPTPTIAMPEIPSNETVGNDPNFTAA